MKSVGCVLKLISFVAGCIFMIFVPCISGGYEEMARATPAEKMINTLIHLHVLMY